jgi:hypothetical protein
MIWIPILKAYLRSGDFALASMQEEANPSICCIVNLASPNDLRVCWWCRHNELSSFDGLESLPPISATSNINLQLCQIQEVVERELSVSTINVAWVKDIVFVFHADQFENEMLNCAGMARKV